MAQQHRLGESTIHRNVVGYVRDVLETACRNHDDYRVKEGPRVRVNGRSFYPDIGIE